MPEHVKFFRPDETLSGNIFLAAGREMRFDPEFCKCVANPKMHALVTFRCLQRIPGMVWRKGQAVSPITIVRDKPAASRTANERAQHCDALEFDKPLGVAKGRGRFRPAVEAQNGFSNFRRMF